MNEPIRLLQPTYDAQTKKELLEVLDSGWTSFGPKVKEFEDKFAEYVGAKYAVATNSATSALDLCLKAYGNKTRGGYLVTPSFTFTSDAHVGEWNNMEVKFADIDPDSFCIDPDSFPLIHGLKAIIAVDCHGRLADIDGLRKKIDDFNKDYDSEDFHIKPLIIEDAAHAMYTPGVGKGDIVVYSFQAVKSMPIYDGGMVTTNDETIYKELRRLTWLGIEKDTYNRAQGGKYEWDYDITRGDGIKAYMTNVQAVIGLGQLRRLPELLEKRQRIQARYNEAFDGEKWFTKPEFSHTVQYYTPKWRDRDGLSKFLQENEIHTSAHFKPLHLMSYWAKAAKYPLPNTEAVWPQILSLPVHDALTDDEQSFVIEKVRSFYESSS